jgi:UDP-N-acetyl-2-amino-2-deoxyglucuronate dehydrogenase
MTEQPVRFAVLGLGMGYVHCKDLLDAKGCELVAVCDANPARLESAQKEFGVRGYADFAELLRDPDVEVVNICTPSGTHADLTVQALKAGKHVVCEKPPDVTVEAVDRMIAAQRESGKQVMVVFQSRFEPMYRAIKAAIDSGRLGKLVGVHGQVTWWRSAEYYDSPGKWKGTWKLDGGGSLANQGVHVLDILQWLAGPVSEVYGRYGVFAHDIESEDKTVAVLTFANGALGTMTTTTAAYPGLDRGILIHGENGTIQTQDDYIIRWALRGESPEAEREEERQVLEQYGRKETLDSSTASDPFAFAWRGHLVQFEAMARAVRENTTPENSIETTRHTIEILNAIYESGRTGQPVKL